MSKKRTPRPSASTQADLEAGQAFRRFESNGDGGRGKGGNSSKCEHKWVAEDFERASCIVSYRCAICTTEYIPA